VVRYQPVRFFDALSPGVVVSLSVALRDDWGHPKIEQKEKEKEIEKEKEKEKKKCVWDPP